MNNTHFFKDKPLFGMDIGSSSIKVMQLEPHDKKQVVTGYGVAPFDPNSVNEGEIVDLKSLAGSVKSLFEKNLVGEINTRRVALSIPASRTYTRTLMLPPDIGENDLLEAVRVEAAQYIPMPLEELYLDFNVITRNEKGIELLAVGAPRRIVDSYTLLARMVGLEPMAFDTTTLASGRFFQRQIDFNDIPSVLIDFGTASADITIHDKTVIVTGTLLGGGNDFIDLVAKKLGISDDEAHIVITKYGLNKSKKQAEIMDALKPRLDSLVKEIRRMIRYYEERATEKQKIEQVITMGGGANMPGMSTFLTDAMRLPVRTSDPWQNLDLGKLQPPNEVEKSMYVTVSGLALIDPKELFV